MPGGHRKHNKTKSDEYVQHTYIKDGGKVECYYCSRGIPKK
jgi:hypothetical protein